MYIFQGVHSHVRKIFWLTVEIDQKYRVSIQLLLLPAVSQIWSLTLFLSPTSRVFRLQIIVNDLNTQKLLIQHLILEVLNVNVVK